jgi:hypothetical protein
LEAAYGAALITLDWQNSDRGLTLIYYFENHPQLLRGKRVFHMAPEKNLSDWIRATAGASHYVTSDASGANADEIRTSPPLLTRRPALTSSSAIASWSMCSTMQKAFPNFIIPVQLIIRVKIL